MNHAVSCNASAAQGVRRTVLSTFCLPKGARTEIGTRRRRTTSKCSISSFGPNISNCMTTPTVCCPTIANQNVSRWSWIYKSTIERKPRRRHLQGRRGRLQNASGTMMSCETSPKAQLRRSCPSRTCWLKGRERRNTQPLTLRLAMTTTTTVTSWMVSTVRAELPLWLPLPRRSKRKIRGGPLPMQAVRRRSGLRRRWRRISRCRKCPSTSCKSSWRMTRTTWTSKKVSPGKPRTQGSSPPPNSCPAPPHFRPTKENKERLRSIHRYPQKSLFSTVSSILQLLTSEHACRQVLRHKYRARLPVRCPPAAVSPL